MRKHGVVAVLLAMVVGWSASVIAADVLNINTASAKELAEQMTGVGEAKAAAIVQYREQHGPYRSVDELVAVKGIGDSLLARNRDRLTAAVDSEVKQ